MNKFLDRKISLIKYMIISVLLPSMHSSETAPDWVCGPTRIDAITSYMNGTVFLAIDSYYWYLNNNTMSLFNHTKSKGLISDLIPGMKSLKLAVSIRTTLTGDSKEILLFHTFEDNYYKYAIYEDNKWSEGSTFIIDFLKQSNSKTITPNELKVTKLVLLYFRLYNTPIIFMRLNTTLHSFLRLQKNWIQVKNDSQIRDLMYDNSVDSYYIKDPSDSNATYTIFLNDHYKVCHFEREQVVCSTYGKTKQYFSIIKDCHNESESKDSDSNQIIWTIICALGVALIILIVILLIICFCASQSKIQKYEDVKVTDGQSNIKGSPQKVKVEKIVSEKDFDNSQKQNSETRQTTDTKQTLQLMEQLLNKNNSNKKNVKETEENVIKHETELERTEDELPKRISMKEEAEKKKKLLNKRKKGSQDKKGNQHKHNPKAKVPQSPAEEDKHTNNKTALKVNVQKFDNILNKPKKSPVKSKKASETEEEHKTMKELAKEMETKFKPKEKLDLKVSAVEEPVESTHSKVNNKVNQLLSTYDNKTGENSNVENQKKVDHLLEDLP